MVKLHLCWTEHHAMKTYEELEVQLHAFFNSVLDGGVWLDSRPGQFPSGKELPVLIS
jgi:hypothetical protein